MGGLSKIHGAPPGARRVSSVSTIGKKTTSHPLPSEEAGLAYRALHLHQHQDQDHHHQVARTSSAIARIRPALMRSARPNRTSFPYVRRPAAVATLMLHRIAAMPRQLRLQMTSSCDGVEPSTWRAHTRTALLDTFSEAAASCNACGPPDF